MVLFSFLIEGLHRRHHHLRHLIITTTPIIIRILHSYLNRFLSSFLLTTGMPFRLTNITINTNINLIRFLTIVISNKSSQT
jgi:hypothetical protein